MKKVDLHTYLNSVAVFLIFLVYNILTNELSFWSNFSRATAITAVIFVCIALFLGPLSRFFPKYFRHDLIFRKPLGLCGTFFALVHALVAFAVTYNYDLFFVFSAQNPNLLPFVYGAIALIILAALAVTSNPVSVKKMGFMKWKMLQRIGYIALAFVVLHFYFVNNSAFLLLGTGKALLIFCIIVLFAKAVVMALSLDKRHSHEEIRHLTDSD